MAGFSFRTMGKCCFSIHFGDSVRANAHTRRHIYVNRSSIPTRIDPNNIKENMFIHAGNVKMYKGW